MAAETMSVRAVMSALRPCWSSNAISPKWSPGPRMRWRPSTVLTSAWPSRITMKPTPSLPRSTGLLPFGWCTSRICLPIFFRSESDMPAKRPTGLMSIVAILKQVGQVSTEKLWALRLLVSRNERPHALEREAGEASRVLALGRDGLAHEHTKLLAPPHVLGAGQPHRYHLDAGLDGEMGEAPVERDELAFG